jgi:hypothetical protein
VYLDKTVPLLEYYAGREWMFTVDGSQPPDAVHADILGRLQKLADLAPGRLARICGAQVRYRRLVQGDADMSVPLFPGPPGSDRSCTDCDGTTASVVELGPAIAVRPA